MSHSPHLVAPVLAPLARVGARPAFFECLAVLVAACARRRACVGVWRSALRENAPHSPPVLAAWADLAEAQADAERSWHTLTAALLFLSRLPCAPGGRA